MDRARPQSGGTHFKGPVKSNSLPLPKLDGCQKISADLAVNSERGIAACNELGPGNCKLPEMNGRMAEARIPVGILLAKTNVMKTTWITVALFDDFVAAKTLEAFFKENKIDARTFNDKLLQVFLFLCPPQATFRVQVRHPIYKMTLDLLNSHPPAILLKAIHCPECGSLRISYPQMTRKFLWPTLFLHLGIIFRFT